MSHTGGRGASGPVREIEGLYREAISSAQRSIYIETQYLTSRAVETALLRRLRDLRRPRLEIAIMLPRRGHTAKEELALGAAQRRVLSRVHAAAREGSHWLGVFNSEEGDGPATMIHSKLMITDDRFLTVGSANLTNRSMSLDTEVNLSWLAPLGSELARRIAALRGALLTEHAGEEWCDGGAGSSGMAAWLTRAAEDPSSRLAPVPIPALEDTATGLLEMACDPRTELVDGLDSSSEVDSSFFTFGIAVLERWMESRANGG